MAVIFMILGMSVFPLTPLHQCYLSTLQPERHLHGAVKLDSGGKLGACLLRTAYPIIQDGETEMAVRQEWAHAKFVSQGEGLAVMGCGLCSLRRLPICRNVAKEP